MTQPGGTARVTYYTAPSGLGHAQASVKSMAKLAREGAHTYAIRSLATKITAGVPSKDRRGELAAIYVWVRDHIRYRFDPVGLEWIQAPARTVAEAAGDCDDLATLIASLAQSLGHRTRFQTVGPTPQNQSHVYAQAHDGRQWVTLDPVLEKRQPTTAPRPRDLGDFSRTAIGAIHTYNDGGTMLGFIPTAAERELWMFEPWEAAQTGHREDRRYRSDSTTGGPPRAYIVNRPPNLDVTRMDGLGRVPYYHPTLGAWGFLKSIGHAVGSVAKVAGKIASAAAPIVGTFNPAIGAALAIGGKAGEAVGGALKHATEKQKKHVAALLKAGHSPAAALAAAGVALPMEPGPNGFPIPAQSPDLAPLLRSLAHLSDRSITTIASLARGAQRNAYHAQRAAQHRAPAHRAPAHRAPRLIKKWDAASKKFVWVAPGGSLHGFKPSFTFSLLGAADPAMASSAGAAVARVRTFITRAGSPPQIALNEIGSFQRANNAQAGAAKLSTDSLWGPNARAAAAYWTETPIDQLPPVARPYLKYATTWTPPPQQTAPDKPAEPKHRKRHRKAPAQTTPAQTAPAQTAPAKTTPAQTTPAQTTPAKTTPAAAQPEPIDSPRNIAAREAAARAAVAAVRTFIKRDAKHRSPAIAIAQVRAFQQLLAAQVRPHVAKKDLENFDAATAKAVDGLYGPKTRQALAAVLKVAETTLPPYAPGFRPKTSDQPAEPAHKAKHKAQHKATKAEQAQAAADEAARKAAASQAAADKAAADKRQREADEAAEEARLAKLEAEKHDDFPIKPKHRKHHGKHHRKAPGSLDLRDEQPATASTGNAWLAVAALYYITRHRRYAA